MNSRERVLAAINHQQPDRVPIDLGGTTNSGISAAVLPSLLRYFGYNDKPIVHEAGQMIGYVDERIVEKMDLDVIGLYPRINKFGARNFDEYQEFMLRNEPVLVPAEMRFSVDETGMTYVYPSGDTNYPPSARMPKNGFYFDNIPRQGEIDDEDLDGRRDFKDSFHVYTDEDLRYFEERAKVLCQGTDKAICMESMQGNFGNVSNIPTPAQKVTPGIRDLGDWMMAQVLYPDYIKEIFEYQCEIGLKNLEMLKQAVGDNIQIITVSGSDFACQRGMLYPVSVFQELYKPYITRIVSWIHENTNWKTWLHCCGGITDIMDDLADTGIDILNPVQCSAAGMDPEVLKGKWGERFTYWGGGVDTQKTLAFGSPEEVREEALERLKIFSKGGGYIFNAIHNIQCGTPLENIIAFYNAVREFNNMEPLPPVKK